MIQDCPPVPRIREKKPTGQILSAQPWRRNFGIKGLSGGTPRNDRATTAQPSGPFACHCQTCLITLAGAEARLPHPVARSATWQPRHRTRLRPFHLAHSRISKGKWDLAGGRVPWGTLSFQARKPVIADQPP